MPEEDLEAVEAANYVTFRDCLSVVVIAQLCTTPPATGASSKKEKRKGRGKSRKSGDKTVHAATVDLNSPKAKTQPETQTPISTEAEQDQAEDLTDFTDYLASEIFPNLPLDLRTLSYTAVRNDAALAAKYEGAIPLSTYENVAADIPPSVLDSLVGCGFLPSSSTSTAATTKTTGSENNSTQTLLPLLKPLLSSYTTSVTTPPPALTPYASSPASTTKSCELCSRDWLPLTYHHLIPRSVHAKVLKRGWHEEWRLNSVAWLCRACHSFVHGIAGNEELAREWWSVELLLGREDVRRWCQWVGRVRWKAR